MRELSIFVDESGSDGLSDRHYLGSVEKVGVRASRSNDADLPGI